LFALFRTFTGQGRYVGKSPLNFFYSRTGGISGILDADSQRINMTVNIS